MAKSSFLPLYQKVADVVRKRIVHGDYALKPIPSERSLAQEIGVNAMTARHGLKILEKEGLLFRQPNGRMSVKKVRQGIKKHLNFAFVTPTLASQGIESCRQAIQKVAASYRCNLRAVLFMHWEDPILLDALSGFDGVFLSTFPEPPPPAIAERLRNKEHPVVVIDDDFSHLGIPSIHLFPPVFIQRLLDHLESLGHKRIGCLNTQPENPEVRERINVWRYWMEAHHFSGRLVNDPVLPYGNTMQHAYDIMSKLLQEPKREETAWFCITIGSAIGAMKALYDHGVRPGHDLALCAANGEGLASFLHPPITALEAADPTPFISYCVRWMMQGGQNWEGPLLMQPSEVPLMIRESTQPRLSK